MSPAKLIYLALVATALALCIVYQGARLRSVGYSLEELRREIAEQRTDRAIYLAQLSRLKNPGRILGLLARLGIDLREQSVAVAVRPQQPPLSPERTGPLAAAGPGLTVPTSGPVPRIETADR